MTTLRYALPYLLCCCMFCPAVENENSDPKPVVPEQVDIPVSERVDVKEAEATYILKKLFKSKKLAVINEYRDQLDDFVGPNALKMLLKAVTHSRWIVRDAAINGLLIQDEKKTSKALKRIKKSEDPFIEASLLLLKSRLYGEKSISALTYFAKSKDPILRYTVAEALREFTFPGDKDSVGKKILAILSTLLKDEDPRVRLETITTLIGIQSKESTALLVRACESTSEEVVILASEELANRPSYNTADTMIRQIQTAKTPSMRINALLALDYLGVPPDKKLIRLCLSDKNWEVRAALCELMGHTAPTTKNDDHEECEKILINILNGDKDWGVRYTAASALAFIGSSKAYQPIVKRMTDKDGEKSQVLVNILRQMTGNQHINEQKDAVLWYEQHADKQKDKLPLQTIPRNTQAKAAFYNFSESTESVVYLLDISQSMTEQRKWLNARVMLWDSVRALESETLFNVIFFETLVTEWSQGPVRASWRNKIKLYRELMQTTPVGFTNTYDGLITALNQWKVELIYFLTDGVPSTGSIQAPHLIAQKITELNHNKQSPARINALGFMIPDAATMLSNLAKYNYGNYESIKQSP